MVVDIVLEAFNRIATGAAFVAGAPFAEVVPGEDSVLVAIVPTETDCVIANLGNFGGTGLRLEHLQGASGVGRGGLIGPPVAFFAFFVAEGAGAGVSEVGEGVGALVAVFPADFHGGAAGFVDLDGGRLGYGHNGSVVYGIGTRELR